MQILIIDNKDSFTFNLVHYLESFDVDVTVWRNDDIDFKLIKDFDKIVVSPGPGLPKEAGYLMQFLQLWYGKKPILGVCLGFQAVAELKGVTLLNLSEVAHGIKTEVFLQNKGGVYFNNLPTSFLVGRYHSWVLEPTLTSKKFTITSKTNQGLIMSAEDVQAKFLGVQFHPESIMTPMGKQIIKNWLFV